MTTALDALRLRLRRMVDDVGKAVWQDADLDTTMHSHRQRVYRDHLQVETTYTSGSTFVYKIFHSHFQDYEGYSAGAVDAFQVEDSVGAQRAIGTTDANPDYEAGIIQMATDQKGTALYVSGWSYDLNGAAADCWQERAAKVSSYYDVSLDGHGLSRGQMLKNCQAMYEMYASKAQATVVKMINQGGW